jgi:uncharacterized protein YlzI (FlbEa/FlbD family)
MFDPEPRSGLMGKFIRLTRKGGEPLFINPDHIVTIGTATPDATADSPALITLVAAIDTNPGAGTVAGVQVRETIQEVVDMIDPPPRGDSMGFAG